MNKALMNEFRELLVRVNAAGLAIHPVDETEIQDFFNQLYDEADDDFSLPLRELYEFLKGEVNCSNQYAKKLTICAAYKNYRYDIPDSTTLDIILTIIEDCGSIVIEP